MPRSIARPSAVRAFDSRPSISPTSPGWIHRLSARLAAYVAAPSRIDQLAPDDATRARRIHLMLLIAAVGFGGYAAFYLALGRPVIGTANAVAACSAMALHRLAFAHPSRARLSWAVHGLSAIGLATFAVAGRVSGGALSMPPWYLVLVPVFVGYVHDRRVTMIWTGAAALTILGVGVLGEIFPRRPEFTAGVAEVIAGQLSLAVLLATLALASRTAADRQIDELASRNAWIRDQAAALVEARDAALASSHAKTDFLARMSHEIRTPLNGILGMASLLAETNPAERPQLDTIQSSGLALRAIIDEILDFARIEAGRLELVERPFDLRACVESALDTCAPQAAAKDLELACTVGPSVPLQVTGDEVRLRQILVNLIGNAVKFTDRGGVLVTIDAPARNGADDRHPLHIAVRDTGIGIPADQLGQLFQPFHQLDSSSTARHEGTGLGLAITQRLAKLMQGTVYARSKVGEGSRFYLDVSMKGAEATRSRRSRLDAVAVGKRILLVEPREITRRSLAQLLESMGAAVHPARSVEEAAQLVLRMPRFDLIVTSHASPDVSALDARTAGIPRLQLARLGPSGTGEPGLQIAEPVRRAPLSRAIGAAFALGGAPAPAGAAAEGAQLARLRILMAEDNPVNQRVGQLMLQRLGHQVDTVVDGAAAVEAALRGRYDVVLMDVRMPVLDGTEAARRIRAEVPVEQQPWIIACTANVLAVDRAECQAAGMDDFLAKPLAIEELRARLATAAAHRLAPPRTGNLDLDAIGRLRELCGGDEAELSGLIRGHLANAALLRAALHTSLAAQDADGLARAAHSLKGTTAMFGASGVWALAAELEAAAHATSMTALSGMVARLEHAHDAACAELERLAG